MTSHLSREWCAPAGTNPAAPMGSLWSDLALPVLIIPTDLLDDSSNQSTKLPRLDLARFSPLQFDNQKPQLEVDRPPLSQSLGREGRPLSDARRVIVADALMAVSTALLVRSLFRVTLWNTLNH